MGELRTFPGMRFLLLKTGDPPPTAITPYQELFREGLELTDLEVADARLGELPEGPWAGVVITGSAASSYADLPWVAPAEDYLRRLAAQDVPIFGVCFGHQLLAQAFGGKVEACPRGWELGTSRVQLTAEGLADPLFDGIPPSFEAQQSHADVVSALPEGAVVLASNPHWGVQAFRLGERIWGTQFHPEFTPETMAAAVERVTPLLTQPLPTDPRQGIRDTPQARRCLANFARAALPMRVQTP